MLQNEMILQRYVCSIPFTYMEAHKNGIYSCCPSWLPNKIGNLDNLDDVWESDILNDIKNSMLDGTYKYCSKTQCPYLSELLETGVAPNNFNLKENFTLPIGKNGPSNINFAFDRSCNLSCPTCRTSQIMANEDELSYINKTMDSLIGKFGKGLTKLYLSGSADPFASKTIRNLLINYDREKLPNVKHIHLHTNGLLLTTEMWDKLKPIHDIIETIEISVDGATKETYELIRRGGKWEVLMENLQFISTLKLKNKRVSFVVQDSNYLEMYDFYILMMNLFNNNIDIYFNKITNWGTYNESEFKLKQIWNETHPEFDMFLIILNKINGKPNCIHNMHDIFNKFKKITLI